MNDNLKGARLAVLAAAFAASSYAFAADAPSGSSGKAVAANDKVHCYGVTSCKGMNDCKTTENACKGQGGHSPIRGTQILRFQRSSSRDVNRLAAIIALCGHIHKRELSLPEKYPQLPSHCYLGWINARYQNRSMR